MQKLTKPVLTNDPENHPRVDLREALERSCSDPIALAALAKAESNLRTYAPREVGRCDWSYDMFQHSVCFVSLPGMSGKDASGWLITPQNVQVVKNAYCYAGWPKAMASAGARLNGYLQEARNHLGENHPQVRLLALCRWNAPNLRKPGQAVTIENISKAWLGSDLATWDPKHARNRQHYAESLKTVIDTYVEEVSATSPQVFIPGLNIDPNGLANPNHLGILGVKGVRVVVLGNKGLEWVKTLSKFCPVDVVITKESYKAAGFPITGHEDAAEFYLEPLSALGVRSAQLGNEPTNTGHASDLQSVEDRNDMYGKWKAKKAALGLGIALIAGAIGTGQPGDLDGVDLSGMQVALNFYDMRFDGWPANWGNGDLGWALPAFKDHAAKTGKPIRISEIGTTTGDRAFQATYLAKLMPWLEARDDVDGAFYFTLQDEPATMNMGLLDPQGNPKPAYAEMFEFTHPEGEPEMPDQNGNPVVGPGVQAAIDKHEDKAKGDERYFLGHVWSITPGEKHGYMYSSESNEVYLAPKA